MTTDTNGAGGLPELPEPVLDVRTHQWADAKPVIRNEHPAEPYYTADQMRAYGELCMALGPVQPIPPELFERAAQLREQAATNELCRATREGDGEVLDELTFSAPGDLHPDTVNLVARFASALAEKLAIAQRKYGWDRHWQSPAWMDQCRDQLVEHVAKGDPRDVAAYCAFLWHHGEPTALRTLSRVAVQEGE